jgi:hypothetical protein
MTRTLQSGHHVYWIEGINTGQGAPAPLPSAPLPQTGWFIGPYLIFWGREAGHYLEEHGLQANTVDVGADTPVIGYEKVIATEVTGWH